MKVHPDSSTVSSCKISVPKIIETSHQFSNEQTWKLFFYEDFKNSFVNKENTLLASAERELTSLVSGDFRDFRVQIDFNAASYLVGIFHSKREIRICTPRLGNELFLIQESVNYESFYHEEDFLKLKSHAESVAALTSADAPSSIEQVTLENNLVDFFENGDAKNSLENETTPIIDNLLESLNSYRPSLFERVSDFGLGLTARFALLRIHLLKFIAILPSLDHDIRGSEVKRILLESLRRLSQDHQKAKFLGKKGEVSALPTWLIFSLQLFQILATLVPASILASVIRTSVKLMAKRFIAGENIELATESFKELFKTGRDVTLDQLGELVVSEKEADHYQNEVLNLIKGFKLHVKKGDKNKSNILKAHVSIKVSALCADFRPEDPEYTYSLIAPRLKKILLSAKEYEVFINIDAEHYHYRDLVFEMYKRVLLETEELKGFTHTGIVIQAYLRDGSKHLKDVVELAKKRGLIMPVRLVKGAYWDAETVESKAHSFNAPEFLNKEETDIHFRQLIHLIFESYPHLQLCLASHNFSDHAYAVALREKKYSELPVIEHQCLHMTYEALSTAMAQLGWVVRNYVPIGSLLVGMAYLVRRIMENSSQVGVLTIMRSHKKKTKLISPQEIHLKRKKDLELSFDETVSSMTDEFFNVAPVRPYLKNHRDIAVENVKSFKASSLGKDYSNSYRLSGESVSIYSSSDESLLVGKIQNATKEDVKEAVNVLDKFYNSGAWAKLPWIVRASTLVRAASLMLGRRNELAALIVYEAGKAINEAYADVDEAIDFLNFYAREEGRGFKHNPSKISRGVVAVISPWNFPLAIPCGMVSSSLVAGNTVGLKSAEQTPLIAQVLVDLLHEAGVPKQALIHLPGEGETVGASLSSHEKVAMVVFTGSKAVGEMLSREVGKRIIKNELYHCEYPAKVITEMGGKNAIIATANAELDETVAGILYSSFGHAGQKCSAASRVIVANSIKDKLIDRLKDACLDMKVSRADDFSAYVNPIISKEDKERLKMQVKEAVKEASENNGKVHVDRSSEELPGHCVGPVVIELPAKRALLKDSYSQRELFGPVIHVIGFDSLDEALKIYNSTEYGLTGGVFSQSQDDIDYLTNKMESGNLYVNRTITGARVGIEPFGGFKLSGTGPKAGSRSYMSHVHLNLVKLPLLEELKKETPLDEKGESFNLTLTHESGLSVQKRTKRVLEGAGFIVNNFESLFQGIYGENKKALKDYLRWLSKGGESFLSRPINNRVIPGQLSFNLHDLKRNTLAVVAYEERAFFTSLMYVIGALFVGTGVTVMARNEKAYVWWNRVWAYMKNAGISSENFDVYFVNEETLKNKLLINELEVVLVDGDISRVKKVLDVTLSTTKDNKYIKKFLTPYDAPSVTHYKKFLEEFVKVRSFAVNTMRHGAPLDIEL